MPLTTTIRDDIRYGYAVGRVRVLAGRMLSASMFERLIDARDLREQKRILAESPYGRYLEFATTAGEVERALEASLADMYDEFLERAELPDVVVGYFRTPHDYENLRIVAKAKAVGAIARATLSGLGTIPPGDFTGDASALPPVMRDLLAAHDAEDEPLAPDRVEAMIDRALFAALQEAARQSGVRFLRELTGLRIDCANARLFVRAHARRLPGAEVAARVVPGGSAALAAIAPEVPRMTTEELASAICATCAIGQACPVDITDVERFDAVADAIVGRRMMAARHAAGGAEPVLAYVLGREGEVALVRTALIGMLSGVDPEEIRARVMERVR